MKVRALALLFPLLACGSSFPNPIATTTTTGGSIGTSAATASATTSASSSTGTHGTSGVATSSSSTSASSSTTSGSAATTSAAATTSGGATTTGSASSTTGSLGSSTTSSSGGSTTSSGGTPITATAEQWTWVPFSNAFCGNGTATGIGVNLNPNSTQLLIYLEGGGACSDELSCYTLNTAANFTGYGPTDFQADVTDPTNLALPGGFFDRTVAANPFETYSYVYVPYCTGDVHAGNNIIQKLGASGPGYFVGYANLSAYLARVVPTFPSATQVVLAGSSAGGFGALYNWWQVQQAFGSIPVTTIDDSGTFLPSDIAPGGGLDSTEATAWNTAGTTPPGCTGCAQDFDALYDFYAQTYPNQRGGLLSYAQDSVLPVFFGISESQFETGLAQEETRNFAPNPSLGYFVTPGMGHVLWFSPQLTANGVTLQSWIASMVTGGTWVSEQ